MRKFRTACRASRDTTSLKCLHSLPQSRTSTTSVPRLTTTHLTCSRMSGTDQTYVRHAREGPAPATHRTSSSFSPGSCHVHGRRRVRHCPNSARPSGSTPPRWAAVRFCSCDRSLCNVVPVESEFYNPAVAWRSATGGDGSHLLDRPDHLADHMHLLGEAGVVLIIQVG